MKWIAFAGVLLASCAGGVAAGGGVVPLSKDMVEGEVFGQMCVSAPIREDGCMGAPTELFGAEQAECMTDLDSGVACCAYKRAVPMPSGGQAMCVYMLCQLMKDCGDWELTYGMCIEKAPPRPSVEK